MATVIFLGSILILFLCRRKMKSLGQSGLKKSVTYKFLEHSREFLLVFSSVLLFYNTLWFFMLLGWQAVSVHFLVSLEQYLLIIEKSLSAWKLTWSGTLVVLFVLYLLGFTKFRTFQTERPIRTFKKAQSVFKVVYLTIVLLCSLTLLGSHAGEPAATLEVHIRTVQDQYGLLRKDVSEALANQTAQDVFGHLREHLGADYIRASESLKKIDDNTGALRDYYASFRQAYKDRDIDVERTLDREARRAKLDSDIQPRTEVPHTEQNSPKSTAADLLADASYGSIKNARSAVARYRSKVSPDLIKLLTKPGGKDIVLHLSNLLSGRLSDALLAPIVEAYPVLKPVIEIFSSTFDDAVEGKIEPAVDDLTKSALDNPEEFGVKAEQQASLIADSAPVRVTPKQAREVTQGARDLQKDFGRLELLHARLLQRAQEIENGITERLLSQLRSEDKETRENAADQLSLRGDRLASEHVNRLLKMLRNGNQEWETNAEREGHCTDYEYTSEKFYAARALKNMKSPYVSDSISAEARECEANGTRWQRVTDPGWV